MQHEFYKDFDWNQLRKKEGEKPVDLTTKIKGINLEDALKKNIEVSMAPKDFMPELLRNKEHFAKIDRYSQSKDRGKFHNS